MLCAFKPLENITVDETVCWNNHCWLEFVHQGAHTLQAVSEETEFAPPRHPPPHFRSCAPGLWRTALSGRHGHFPLAPSNTNTQAGTSCSRGPLRAAFLGLSSILDRFLHPSYRVGLRDDWGGSPYARRTLIGSGWGAGLRAFEDGRRCGPGLLSGRWGERLGWGLDL